MKLLCPYCQEMIECKRKHKLRKRCPCGQRPVVYHCPVDTNRCPPACLKDSHWALGGRAWKILKQQKKESGVLFYDEAGHAREHRVLWIKGDVRVWEHTWGYAVMRTRFSGLSLERLGTFSPRLRQQALAYAKSLGSTPR